MNITQIGSKIRAQIHEFSGKLSPHFSKPTQHFIEQMVYGILLSQDVKLSQVTRALEEEISYKKTENRLSVNLNKEGLAQELQEQIVRMGSRRVKPDTLLIIDISDLRKDYAKKMEYLAQVRDGSKGELCQGYWWMNVIACSPGGRKMVPLYQSLYSAAAPEFSSENTEILKAIDLINGYCPGGGIYVGDRGLDRIKLYNPLLDRKLHFIIRLEGDRDLIFRGGKRLAKDLASGCPLWYRDTIIKEEGEKEKRYHLEYGFRKVRLPGREEELGLVVVKGFGEDPLMLLTNLPVRKKRNALWFIIDGYLTRWRIEEAIRFSKQSYNLEDIRVLRYRRLCNLIALALAAAYFSAAYLGEGLKLAVLARRVMQAAKRFYGIASFHYYAIADGLAYILRRMGKGPWVWPLRAVPSQQLVLPLVL